MMGNWSLGDYFKKESLEWSREFLTSSEYLWLDPEKIWCSVFGWYSIEGKEVIPYDQIAHDTLLNLGMNPSHIKSIAMFKGEKCDNFWWPAGAIGPCWPCAEFHYDRGDAYGENDWDIGENDRFIEIRNNVFMEFYKDDAGEFTQLSQQNTCYCLIKIINH
jgi:alanyl-tRNA synthetase